MARPSKQHQIEFWLKGLLGAGRRKAEDVLAAGEGAGYSERSLRRVKIALGIVSEQVQEIWYWRDPTIEQAKPQSADKTDVLIHKVEELTRLSQPAAPVPQQGPVFGILGKKTRAIDITSPEAQAQFERIRKAHERFEAQQAVVTSPDPFKLLEDAANDDELQQMMLRVREHRSMLGDRERGKPRFKKAWQVTEHAEERVVGRDWDRKLQKWVDVPATQTTTKRYISDIPVEGATAVDVPDGFELGEDVTFEMGKWDSWIDRAKQREREFLTRSKAAS
jgi:hypothetical protein